MALRECRSIAVRLPVLLIALALVHGALYATLTPPWQAPDEPRHFQYARLILDLRRVPSAADAQQDQQLQSELYQALQEQEYWQVRSRLPTPEGEGLAAVRQAIRQSGLRPALNHPPLPYLMGALVLWPLKGASVPVQMYGLRALGVVFGAVAAAAAFRLAVLLLPGDPNFRWAAGLFVATLPMQSFIAGSVNNDPVAQAFASVAILALARLVLAGWSWRRGAAFVGAAGLAVACKDTALFLLPLAVTAIPLVRRAGTIAEEGRERMPRWGVAAAGTVFVLAAAAMSIAANSLWLADLRQGGFNLLLTFASFWANFGWMNVPLDVGWYVALGGLTLVAAAGWLALGLRFRERESVAALWALYTLAVMWIVVQAVSVAAMRREPAQGRYLFPALAPIAVCVAAGLLTWIPDRFRRAALVGLFLWWAAFDLVALFGYLIPRLYA